MKALRFSPPEVPWSPELRWVLARAFGPPDRPFGTPFEAAEAVRLATRFDLSARIGARTSETILASEAGSSAPALRRAAQKTVAQNLLLVESVRSVARTAARGDVPFLVLKGLALEALQLVPTGARPTGDLDLLVPESLISRFQELLVADGWTPTDHPDFEQHVDPLVHPMWGTVEIHRVILGVRPPGGRRSFGHEALVASGLTEAIPGLPELVRAPSRQVLLAHALVHGLVQHGNAPDSYPLFRVLGDVADLGPSPESLAEAGAFLREVDSEDLAGIGDLVRLLGSGLPSTLCAVAQSVDGRPDPFVLLRHLVAGATNPEYCRGLKGRYESFVTVSDRPPLLAALRALSHAVFLTRREVDDIYGPPRTRLGTLARQVARPFDLVLRYGRALRARRK